MAEPIHRWPVRVYYEDTDAGGVVYHAQYLNYCERGRTEFMRALGLDHRRLLAEYGLIFTVRRATLDLRRPAQLDDALEVTTAIARMRGARLDVHQEVRLAADVLAAADLELAVVGRDLRPRRLPPALTALFGAWTVAVGRP